MFAAPLEIKQGHAICEQMRFHVLEPVAECLSLPLTSV